MTTASPEPTDDELGALIGRSLRLLDAAVPAWATQRALDAWRAPQPAAPGVLARLAAELRYDSWLHGTPAAALRSGGAAPRQLLFAVGAHDVDLRVQADPGADDRFEITGQVLGPATQGTAAWLADAESGSAAPVALDDLGEFVLAPLAAGRGNLRLVLDGQTIELPSIDLGSAPASG